jgi:DNA-nicking Smr family endonuclease
VPSINLKAGLPTVDGALRKLKRELQDAKADRRRLVRIIHGYGSTGVGGEIRVAVRKQLQGMLTSKKIQSFLPGEDYSDSTNAGEALLARHLGLRSSLRTDSRNPGITFVEL